MQPRQIVGCLGGGAGCGEDGLLVGLEDLQPVVEVDGVVGTRFQRKPKVDAEEGSPQLGHESFDGVGLIGETLAELTLGGLEKC